MVEVCPSFGNPLPHADIAAPAAAPIAVCIAGEQRSFYTIAESIQRTFVAVCEETDFYLALGGLTEEAAQHAQRVFSRLVSVTQTMTRVGTVQWAAPEVLLQYLLPSLLPRLLPCLLSWAATEVLERSDRYRHRTRPRQRSPAPVSTPQIATPLPESGL